MKVGDLVRYGRWYKGKKRPGIIVEKDSHGFFLVLWRQYYREWEDEEELELAK